jgi:hypothetical protein
VNLGEACVPFYVILRVRFLDSILFSLTDIGLDPEPEKRLAQKSSGPKLTVKITRPWLSFHRVNSNFCIAEWALSSCTAFGRFVSSCLPFHSSFHE